MRIGKVSNVIIAVVCLAVVSAGWLLYVQYGSPKREPVAINVRNRSEIEEAIQRTLNRTGHWPRSRSDIEDVLPATVSEKRWKLELVKADYERVGAESHSRYRVTTKTQVIFLKVTRYLPLDR